MKLWIILSVLVGYVLSDPEDFYLVCLVFKPEQECRKILEGGVPEISGSSASAASSTQSGTASAAASATSGNVASSAAASTTDFGGSAAAVAAAVTTSGGSATASSSATATDRVVQPGFSFKPLTGNAQMITIPKWFGGFGGSSSISSSTSSNNNDVSSVIQSIFPDGSATAAASSSSFFDSSFLQSPPPPNIFNHHSFHDVDPCSHIHPAFRGSCNRGLHRPSRRPPPRRHRFPVPRRPWEVSAPGPEIPSSMNNNHLLFPL
ncbi:uncharacterized protein LOC133181007 [Saccostrea echinata]|uniref:uncharacterized protein LOC133181007 n=1 Tax=Saccostrea echinata TaxID=191078 RepID=UPI002A822805|nr:uncharacterized protein LOC133181007 [Saccostrea echinata]XP_061171497.1 uncharacterized protein LOC133181007 [Saccostrea echinata]XP_061171498.1 uncharacterized protein LOC133181007 [Saccostrea echinata]